MWILNVRTKKKKKLFHRILALNFGLTKETEALKDQDHTVTICKAS